MFKQQETHRHLPHLAGSVDKFCFNAQQEPLAGSNAQDTGRSSRDKIGFACRWLKGVKSRTIRVEQGVFCPCQLWHLHVGLAPVCWLHSWRSTHGVSLTDYAQAICLQEHLEVSLVRLHVTVHQLTFSTLPGCCEWSTPSCATAPPACHFSRFRVF